MKKTRLSRFRYDFWKKSAFFPSGNLIGQKISVTLTPLWPEKIYFANFKAMLIAVLLAPKGVALSVKWKAVFTKEEVNLFFLTK